MPAISKHLSNVFETGELKEESTISKMETVQLEDCREVKRLVVMYKLDAVISEAADGKMRLNDVADLPRPLGAMYIRILRMPGLSSAPHWASPPQPCWAAKHKKKKAK